MRLLLLALLAGATVIACERPPARRADDRVVVQVAPPSPGIDGALADTGAPSLEKIAREAYAAISAGRFADARARLDEWDDRTDHCTGSAEVRKLPDGFAIVTGPRGLVVTNASGGIVSHEVTPGCLRYADATLRIVSSERTFRIAERDAITEIARDEGTSPETERVFVSEAWALVVEQTGGWIALNRRTGRLSRAQDRDATVAGEWLVVDGSTGITMRHADGRVAGIRGCDGELRAAVRTEREVAVHVGNAPGSDAHATDTRVCLVREDGSTRKVVRLGWATCGLARPLPCPFVLHSSTPRLLEFGSMRGETKLVDAVAGRTLQGGQLEQGEPRTAWCIRASLPVPSAVCEDDERE